MVSVEPLRIVLVEPQIPPNTGNIGRTCVGLGIELWLVGRLGFSLSERRLKRAGLDYWPKLQLVREPDLGRARARLEPFRPVLATSRGDKAPWEVDMPSVGAVCFGGETQGFPPDWYALPWPKIRLPQGAGIRSYNLANTVHSVAMEWVRQTGWLPQ